MGLAYNPRTRSVKTKYVVSTTGDNWFQPATGYGDNANSGTKAQRLAQCKKLVGTVLEGDPAAEVQVGSEQLG